MLSMSDWPPAEPPPPTPPPPGPPPPGWWLASDGRYYPPEQAPAAFAPPPPGAGMPYGTYSPYGVPVASAPKPNGLAIASMVCGIIWIYWIGSILALVFGYVAKSQIDRSAGRQSGRGMAIAGIVLGWIGVAMLAVIIVVAVAFRDQINFDPEPRDGICNERPFPTDPDCPLDALAPTVGQAGVSRWGS